MGAPPQLVRALKVYLAAGVMTTTVATPIMAYTTWRQRRQWTANKNTPQRIEDAYVAVIVGVWKGVGYGIIWPITCGVVAHDAYKGNLNK